MSEYIIQGETLSALADEVRTLSGTEETMSLDAMETNINEANEEISSQADLLAQIQSVLEGKTAGSGSGDGSVETCTVTVKVLGDSSEGIVSYAATTVNNGMVESAYDFMTTLPLEVVINNVLCGSTLVVMTIEVPAEALVYNGVEFLGNMMSTARTFRAPTTAGANGVIELNM